MKPLEHLLNRRTFFKLNLQFALFTLELRGGRAAATPRQQPSSAQAGYGIGAYGTGNYVGHTLYLPLINKEAE